METDYETFYAGARHRSGGEGSYIEVLSISGLLGGIPFFAGLAWGTILLFRRAASALAGAATSRDATWCLCTAALVVLLLVNSVGEGYLAAVGSAPTIYVWVAIGTARPRGGPNARAK
jgi:hypothetical protein